MKLAAIAALTLITAACSGDSSPSAPTSVATTPPPTITPTPQPTPTPTPTPPPTGPRTQFGAGTWNVGSDIAAGRYFADPATNCYWERRRGNGGTIADVIANDFVDYNAGQLIVDILSSDFSFDTDNDCGTWFTTARTGAKTTITPGVWLVGSQLSPGQYRTQAVAGCYWERLRNFQGTVSASVIANDFMAAGGQATVTLSASDAGFRSDGNCGTWSRLSASLQPQSVDVPQSLAEIEANHQRNR
jgi:hypothetical protein